MENQATRRVRLGMLTPSSNSVLEPAVATMLMDLPDVSAHFARFRVTEIALSDSALAQFDDGAILHAAERLADVKPHVIAWNGTSAGWLGFDRDERLCERITAATGIAACTSILAFREIFELTRPRRIGLITPYTEDVQRRIASNWGAAGFPCTAERHCGLRDNFSFAEVDADQIRTMARETAQEGCEALAVVCTNMRGTALAAKLEAELGIPVYDSIATTVWKSLAVAGVDPRRVTGFGSLFALAPR